MKPKDVKTMNDICKLQTDGFHSKTHWTGFDNEKEIVIVQQKAGEAATGKIRIPRHIFHKIIAWYERDQKERKR